MVEHITGLGALIGGGGDQLWGTTYSTAMQQGTSQEQSTSITLDCGSADQFWVDVYFDAVFRTFLTLRGDPIDATTPAPVAGVVQRSDGSRWPRQLVRLRIGGETYVTRSDDIGSFSFPVRARTRGAGQIQVGNDRYSVSYVGAPKSVVLRTPAPAGKRP